MALKVTSDSRPPAEQHLVLSIPCPGDAVIADHSAGKLTYHCYSLSAALKVIPSIVTYKSLQKIYVKVCANTDQELCTYFIL